MAKSYDKQLGLFLRKQRGEMPYSRFAKRLGIGVGTLHRLELAQQSITLGKLEDILTRLKCTIGDVFPE